MYQTVGLIDDELQNDNYFVNCVKKITTISTGVSIQSNSNYLFVMIGQLCRKCAYRI